MLNVATMILLCICPFQKYVRFLPPPFLDFLVIWFHIKLSWSLHSASLLWLVGFTHLYMKRGVFLLKYLWSLGCVRAMLVRVAMDDLGYIACLSYQPSYCIRYSLILFLVFGYMELAVVECWGQFYMDCSWLGYMARKSDRPQGGKDVL